MSWATIWRSLGVRTEFIYCSCMSRREAGALMTSRNRCVGGARSQERDTHPCQTRTHANKHTDGKMGTTNSNKREGKTQRIKKETTITMMAVLQWNKHIPWSHTTSGHHQTPYAVFLVLFDRSLVAEIAHRAFKYKFEAILLKFLDFYFSLYF